MRMTGLRLVGLSTINLPLFGAQPSDQFILKAADGLGPVGRDVSFARGVFKRAEDQDREAVIRIALNPNWTTGITAEQLRSQVYGLLSDGVSDLTKIQVMNESVVAAEVTGVVRLVEIVPFSKDPEVQVTILCGEPYLMAPLDVTLNFASDTASPTVDVEGTVPAYFLFRGELTEVASYFSLYISDPGLNKIRVDASLGAGTQVYIDTRPGMRKVEFGFPFTTEEGTTYNWYNYVDKMTSDSGWPKVSYGVGKVLNLSQPVLYGSLLYKPIFRGI